MSEYPRKIYASVLLYDNKIVMWKVGDSYWPDYSRVSVKSRLPGPIKDMKTVYTHFEAKDSFENNRIFDWDSKLWFKNWEIHEQCAGAPAY